MPRIVIIPILAIILASCTPSIQRGRIEAWLSAADSLMDERPDSALRMLNGIAPEMAKQPRDISMRHALLVAKAQNKAYVDLTTDSVMLRVAEWYDSHGTPNDRMMAHYLLGCTYRDMHEAPVALTCYLDALERADTLSPDCDFALMMRIWGQISHVYRSQLMPEEELRATERYSHFARRAGDEYEHIRGVEQQIAPYALMGDTARMLATMDRARDLYLAAGMEQAAHAVYPQKIAILISQGSLGEARRLMHEYENLSGLFDAQGNIARGREMYYAYKGDYLLAAGQPDSARLFYDKALRAGYRLSAYEGKMRVCQAKGQLDSARAYFSLYTAEYDQHISAVSHQATLQAQGMYNYTRQQQIARRNEAEARTSQRVIYILAFAVILAALAVFLFVRKRQQRARQLMTAANRDYSEALMRLHNTVAELDALKTDKAQFEAAKRQEIDELRKITAAYRDNTNTEQWDTEQMLLQHSIVQTMHRHAATIAIPAESEWRDLQAVVEKLLPDFHAALAARGAELTDNERRICLLTRLGFIPTEIAALMNFSKQRVSNLRGTANKKLFGAQTTKSFDYNIRQL